MQIDSFRTLGHVHLKGVCSAAEVATYSKIISDKAFAVWDDAGATVATQSIPDYNLMSWFSG